MQLSPNDVLKIAHLARLSIDEQAIDNYANNLSGILDFVEQMNAVNTQGVEPMAHPLEMSQRLREDVVTETDQRDMLQASAPAVEAGLYLVPKVID